MLNTMVLETGSKLRLPSCYVEVSNDEMEYLDGAWSAWKTWAVIGASFGIVAAGLGIAAAIVGTGGVATGLAIGSGGCWIAAGVSTIISVCNAAD